MDEYVTWQSADRDPDYIPLKKLETRHLMSLGKDGISLKEYKLILKNEEWPKLEYFSFINLLINSFHISEH